MPLPALAAAALPVLGRIGVGVGVSKLLGGGDDHGGQPQQPRMDAAGRVAQMNAALSSSQFG